MAFEEVEKADSCLGKGLLSTRVQRPNIILVLELTRAKLMTCSQAGFWLETRLALHIDTRIQNMFGFVCFPKYKSPELSEEK